MKRLNPLITGTAILAATGILTKFLGFIYRIWLSRLIGSEEMGIYQLIFPIFGLCYGICCGPLQTAISKFTAEDHLENGCLGKRYYRVGLSLSLFLSLLCAIILYCCAKPIALYFLLEKRCIRLLKILAFAIPFNAIHTCICGYYYGQKKTGIPAAAQLTEQIFRMLFVYISADILTVYQKEFSVATAVVALSLGELVSAVFCIFAIELHFSKHHLFRREKNSSLPSLRKQAENIFELSLPLTANRLILSLLQSIEAVLIPHRLELFGLIRENALSIYGVFTGMAMPFILFPSALSNALSLMLLPEIAKEQAQNNKERISYTALRSSEYCLSLGILCVGIFLTQGNLMGSLFFPDTGAGNFILILSWLCPFLYLNSTYTSILNGLGKTNLTFFNQLSGLLLRLFFILFFIPKLGIFGYFLGLLLSLLLTCLLNFCQIKRFICLNYTIGSALLKPIVFTLLSVGVSKSINFIFPISNQLILLVVQTGIISLSYFTLLLLTRKKQATNV